ncbi:MAG TPA: ABC transporter substrate-binding protein [Candidatus Krumholzibacteria bacterium]|nr:ABC transporter substrate-binding protein [Candidatus Krumholzibacteria bacterium]
MRVSARGAHIIVAGLAVLALATGCAGRENHTPMLELALENAPNRLDPAFVVDATEGEVCSLIFDGLVGFAPDGSMVPCLARSWSVSDDGTHYQFHLDTRAMFSNGKPVQANDVVASFRRVLDPATASPRAWVLSRIRGAADFQTGKSQTIAGLTAPDDSTLAIELEAPFAPFLSLLALPAARVIDTRTASGDVPVGSGPWQLSEWLRSESLTLLPNPHRAHIQDGVTGIHYRIIPEPFTRIAEFESGTIDVLEIPDAEVSRFRSDKKYADHVLKRPELRVFYVGINNTKFTDVRVRRALNHAVNVPALVRVLASGEAVPAHGSVPPALPGYRERPGYEYDPARARALLAEAGYPNGLSLEIWQRESAEGNRVLEAVQGYLLAAGVHATLVRREWSAFKEAVNAGKVDAFFLDWIADYPEAENFLFPLFDTANQGGGGNRSRFSDAEVDRRLDATSRMVDPAARDRAYAEIDSLVYAEAPWIYLYFPTSFHVVSPHVSGYKLPSVYLANDFSQVRKMP